MKQTFLLKLPAAILLLQIVFIFSLKAQVDDERAFGNKSVNGKRIALVIGNADYDPDIGKLKNPVNDAGDMADALKRLGFSLVGGKAQLNLSRRQMLEQIREFGSQIRQGGVGVFYFAGHGVQVDRRNYLIPITDSLKHQEDAEYEAVDVDSVLREMEYAENALNILILDACRNNALPKKTRNTDKGLTRPREPSGVYIAFAARDGQTASENSSGRNGLFTQELLKNIETPKRLEDIFIDTRNEVKRISKNSQEPVEYGALNGVFYFKENKSIETIQSAIKILPFSPISEKNAKRAEQISQLGEELRNKEDYELAIKNFTDALNYNPDSDFAFSRRGECYRVLGQFDKAIENLNEAIRRNPKNDFAYASRGVTYWEKGKNDLVMKDLNEAIRLNPNYDFAYFMRGDFLQKHGDCKNAVDDLTRAISLYKFSNYLVYQTRSDAYLCQGNLENAVADLNIILKIEPDLVVALERRMMISIQKRDFNNALTDSMKLIQLNSQESERYYFLRAILFTQQLLFKDAIKEIDSLISLNGESKILGYSFRGLLYAGIENNTQALADLNLAIKLSKESSQIIIAYFYRIMFYSIIENYKKALTDIKVALKINIEDKETEPILKSLLYFAKAMIEFDRGKNETALININLAISMFPNVSGYYLIRSEIHKKLGNDVESLEDEKKSEELKQLQQFVEI